MVGFSGGGLGASAWEAGTGGAPAGEAERAERARGETRGRRVLVARTERFELLLWALRPDFRAFGDWRLEGFIGGNFAKGGWGDRSTDEGGRSFPLNTASRRLRFQGRTVVRAFIASCKTP